MENAITFSAKQEDGITRKCYNQKMLIPKVKLKFRQTVKKVDVCVKCWFYICISEPDFTPCTTDA
jgi:hypothetical protein